MKTGMTAGVLLVIATSSLRAQQWSAEAHAGRIRSALDPASSAYESVAVGIRYERSHTAFRISAGVPTRSAAPLWGAAAAAHRFAARPGLLIAGVDVAANGFVLLDRAAETRELPGPFQPPTTTVAQSGFAGAAQVMPVLGIETAKLHVHVRGGASQYVSEIGEQRRDRRVTLADAQLTLFPTPAIAFMPAVRHFIAEEADYTMASVTGFAGVGKLNVWGSVGRWLNADDRAATWSAGASLRLDDRWQLSASGRRDVLDPLYATPDQTSWSLGLAMKLGGVTPRMPAAVVNAGMTIIKLPAAQSPAAPRVAGDFSGWTPQPMQRRGDHWIYQVALQPGVYNYAFVDANGAWFVPEKHPGRKRDGMGGDVAVLVVR